MFHYRGNLGYDASTEETITTSFILQSQNSLSYRLKSLQDSENLFSGEEVNTPDPA